MSHPVLPPSPAQMERARLIVERYLRPTPTTRVSLRGRDVWAKLESLQPTGSFKIRGALSAVSAAAENAESVITSSAGNHGLGIAHAASLLGVRATVVVPANASKVKVERLARYDIELIQVGSSYDDAQDHARELAAQRSLHFISPFNDSLVIAGQATCLAEMLEQAPDLEHLVVSVGGGGLISGCLLAREAASRPNLRITGVQPSNSAALFHVLSGSAMTDVVHHPTIADGLAGGGDEGAITNELIARAGVPIVLVPEHDIRAAVGECVDTNGLVLEGSATASYAAIVHDLISDTTGRVGFIATGRNIAHDLLVEILSESPAST